MAHFPGISRARREIGQRVSARSLERGLSVQPRDDLAWIGSSYGGWPVPTGGFSPDSVCYLAGLGTDGSFDLGLIERFGCTVHSFDPVPEAAEYAHTLRESQPRFVFHQAGLWSADGALRFYDNAEPGFVSRSATNMHGTSTFWEANVRAIDSLMSELGHDHVDLLKLSVEGSEYEIVDDVLRKQLPIGVLCVEFAQPAPLGPIRDEIERLEASGYQLVNVSLRPLNWRLTFVGENRR
jgi:FkbM family methyltransferase